MSILCFIHSTVILLLWKAKTIFKTIGPKFNVHKTFRRRLRYLRNYSCTFNLRPVRRGFKRINKIPDINHNTNLVQKHNNIMCTTILKVSVLGVFLVRIFPHSNWIRRDSPYLSVFSLNAGKYGPEKLRVRILYAQCILMTQTIA